MATQKWYRLQGRNPRYTDMLTTFANGMYVTSQTIPQGYAKYLINYDIDDTGSYIKPKRGRRALQSVELDTSYAEGATLTDYLYAYNEDGTEVVDTVDVVLSLGRYAAIKDLLPGSDDSEQAYYLVHTIESRHSMGYYDGPESEKQPMDPDEEDVITTLDSNALWCLAYNKDTDKFDNMIVDDNNGIGYLRGRTFSNAWAFDKKFKTYFGRPVYTVMSNEVIAFIGDKINYDNYPESPIYNELNYGNLRMSKLQIKRNSDEDPEQGYNVTAKTVDVRIPTFTEATNTGFNILFDDPYGTFDEVENSGSYSILGVITKDANGEIVISPDIGTETTVEVHFKTLNNGKPKIKIQLLDGDTYVPSSDEDQWVTELDWTEIENTGVFQYQFFPQNALVILRVILRNEDDTSSESPYIKQINTVSKAYKGVKFYTYDLSTCKGMISWQSCVGVYGVENAPNEIFFSSVEDPGYFPFPYNMLTFDNEVYAVYNYLDHLVVITASSIWLVKMGSSIMTSTMSKIMDNINISELDACNIVILKDSIFFKTDNGFYVLKPNQYTSDASDLKKYINSTAISNLTNNFTEEVTRMLNLIYKQVWQRVTTEKAEQYRFIDFDLLDNTSYLKHEEVHYIYKIQPILGKERNNTEEDLIRYEYLNLHLVYNTLTRAWRTYFVSIGGENTGYGNVLYRNKKSGVMYEFFTNQPKFMVDGKSELMITSQTYNIVDEDVKGELQEWNLSDNYNNYTFIDTGNVSLNEIALKRFRELQIAIYSKEKEKLSFFVDFRIDGAERVAATHYDTEVVTDKDDPNYGTVFVRPIEVPNMYKYQASTLAEERDDKPYWFTDDDEISHLWQLDLSAFPELDTINMKIELIGKGRRGAIQLLNTSLQQYELANWLWVYRLMNVR